MKVALACHNFPPEFTGGTERVVAALARSLTELGDDVVVIAGSDRAHEGCDVLEEDYSGVPVLRVPRKADEGYGLEIVRSRVVAVLREIVRGRRIEVLHAHHWSTLSVAQLRMAREEGLVAVATLHDMWTSCGRFFRRPPEGVTCPDGIGREPCGPCAQRSLDVPIWGLRLGIADRDREIASELGAANAITAPSAFCAEATRRLVPWKGPIEVVPHGLLEPVGRAVEVAARSSGAFRIGTFGNLVAEKGVMVLVEAVAGLPDVELRLDGAFLDAAFEAEVRDRAEQLGVRLVARGAFAEDRPHPARDLDVAVFPSLCHETYGLVVEEALARGVPVVVSDLGALSERIGDAGMIAKAGDVAALRDVLRTLREDPTALERLRAAIPTRFPTMLDAARRYRRIYASET